MMKVVEDSVTRTKNLVINLAIEYTMNMIGMGLGNKNSFGHGQMISKR